MNAGRFKSKITSPPSIIAVIIIKEIFVNTNLVYLYTFVTTLSASPGEKERLRMLFKKDAFSPVLTANLSRSDAKMLLSPRFIQPRASSPSRKLLTVCGFIGPYFVEYSVTISLNS